MSAMPPAAPGSPAPGSGDASATLPPAGGPGQPRAWPRPRQAFPEALLVFGLCLAGLVALYGRYLASYAPTADEIALLAASRSFQPLDWVRHGFSRYFVVFPEWTAPYTNFIRPVANLLFYLHERAFGPRYWVQLVTVNYACHAGLCALLYLAARTPCRRTRLQAGAVAALGFVGAPFFSSFMPVSSSWSFDGVAGLLCLAAAIAFALRARLPAMALMLLAVFTKESALPAAAALLAVAVLWRDRWGAALMASPIALWAALRTWAFGTTLGAYPFSGIGLSRLAAVASVPIGYGSAPALRAAWHAPGGGPPALAAGLALAVNCGALLFCARALLRDPPALLRSLLGAGAADPAARLKAIAPPAAVASFAYVAAVGGEARFGYVGWALLCLALATRLGTSLSWRWLAIPLATCTVGAVVTVAASRSERSLALAAVVRAYSDQLLRDVRAPTSSGGEVVIANDLGLGFTSDALYAQFAGATRPIERLNSVDLASCSPADLTQLRATCQRSAGRGIERILIHIPDCSMFFFPGAQLGPSLSSGNTIQRGEMRYTFPELVRSRSLTGSSRIDLGHSLSVEFAHPLRGECLSPRMDPGGRLTLQSS